MENLCRFLILILGFVSSSYGVAEGRSSLVRSRRQSDANQSKKIICYYAFWAARRPGEFKFVPKNIDPTLCTHILYGYARLEPTKGIVPYDYEVDIQNRGWESMVELKKINPDVKVLLSVGGLFEGSARFTKMAADIDQRETFVRSARSTLEMYGFDGVDISWLYPGFSAGSSSADKTNYVKLMRDLKEELKDEFILSMSVPALASYIDSGYDVPLLLNYTDFMNVLAYSYHDSTDATVNHHGPLYTPPSDPSNKDANVDATIRDYIRRGARPDQLTLVIPLYGVAFVLEDADDNDIGASTEDEGMGLEEPGALIYFELCQRIRKESWTVKKVNSTAMGPYAYKDKLWVAYDDLDMVKRKAKYALDKGLGGLGFWTVDQDDFRGMCHLEDFPLLRGGRQVFLESESATVPEPDRESAVGASGNDVSPTSGESASDILQPISTTSEPTTSTTTTIRTAPTRTTTIRTAPTQTTTIRTAPTRTTTIRTAPTQTTTIRTAPTQTTTIRTAPTRTTTPRTIRITARPAITTRSPPIYQEENNFDRMPFNSWFNYDGDVYFRPESNNNLGPTVFRSNRDIIFSDLQIRIANYYHGPVYSDRF